MARTTDAILAFAGAAYDYVVEKTSPVIDGTMLRVTWEKVEAADRALSTDDRIELARLAGR